MPFASKRQARWAFANKKPFARRWAKQTDFASLPASKDAGTDAAAPLHGPGGLLATPGLGRQRWRTKAKQIVGNLYRGNDGKFQAGGADSAPAARGVQLSKQPTPKRVAPAKTPKGRGGGKGKGRAAAKPKPKQTPEQRQQERQAARDAEQAQNRDAVKQAMADADQGLAPAGFDNLIALGDGKEPDAPGAQGLIDMGMAERGSDGVLRLTSAGRAAIAAANRGDAKAAIDAVSRGQDQVKRQTEAAQRRTQAQQERTARQQQRQQELAQRAAERKKRQQEAEKKRASGSNRTTTTTTAPKAPTAAQLERAARQERRNADAIDLMQAGGKLRSTQMEDLIDAGLAERRGLTVVLTPAGQQIAARKREKSFTVFKDARGQHRWLARTTTAYRDRDGEILATEALDADSQRMTATKQFGPLRYWHIGQPDPSDPAAPWGPGVDLGMCDYSVVIGRTRVESGTFKSEQIARQVAAVADKHEMSPGFFHPEGQPGPDGVFSSMRTFERSLVPMRYARASNVFTGFTVKEHRMDPQEMERRFKAAIAELGLDAQQAAQLGADLIATEKAASQQQIAYKEADAPEEITLNGQTYVLKAAAPVELKDDGMGDIETQADGDMPIEDVAVELEPDADELDGDVIGNMSRDEFSAFLAELLAPVLKMQDMVKSMGDMHGELKSMYGTATKAADDAKTANAAEIAALKAQQQALAARLAELEGDAPAVTLPTEVEAALKSAGPQVPEAPADPELAQAIADPNRPLAALAARTMPQLYRNTIDGGFAGWTPPPIQSNS